MSTVGVEMVEDLLKFLGLNPNDSVYAMDKKLNEQREEGQKVVKEMKRDIWKKKENEKEAENEEEVLEKVVVKG